MTSDATFAISAKDAPLSLTSEFNVAGFMILYLDIFGVLGWGACTADAAAWKNLSTIAFYASSFHNMPETTYQAVKVKVDRT